MQELRFDGRVAVVTGAGRGLGRSYALFLAERGARVLVNDLGVSVDGGPSTEQPADSVVREIRQTGGSAVANDSDVSTTKGAEAIVAAAIESYGRVDIVINNAGILRRSDFPATTLEDFQQHVAVHLLGTFNVTRAAWPHMAEQRYGRVVLTTSEGMLGRTHIVPYSSAKAGMVGLGRSLAKAGAKLGIRVNIIAPRAATRMSSSVRTAKQTDSRELSPPRKVSAIVAVLVHELCPNTGEIYWAGGDRVTRMFVGETRGFTKRDFTPEEALANWAAVEEEADYTVERIETN